jgi:hypothetical protein
VLALTQPSYYFLFALSLLLEFSWLLYLMSKTMKLYFVTRKNIHLGATKN